MSGSDSDSNGSDAGPGSREVAQRLFAAEFDDATFSYSESDEERAPNYVVSPTGARINRMFAVGVLTEVESVNEDIVRGRVVDATGPFVSYAGQYQPDEQAYLERTTPPEFVALTGKARTFQPEDSDRIYTSVRPESINSVDADTRDRWLVTTAESTLQRLAVMRDAVDSDLRGDDLRAALEAAGVQSSLATGVPYAIDHYGTTTAYLEAVRQLAVDALEVVAGERDEVRGLSVAPDEGGSAELGPLPEGVDLDDATSTSADASESTDTDGPVTTDATSAASTGSTLDADAAADETAAEPAEAASTDEATPTESVEDEPTSDTTAADSASADASGAASTGSTVDAESGAAEPAEAAGPSDAEDDLGDFDSGTDADAGDDTEPAAAGAADAASTGSLVDEDDSTAAEPAEAAETAGAGDTGADDPSEEGMYELGDDERREVEEEFGTEFSTGNDVADPGEADIDVPDADDLSEEVEDEEDAASAGATGTASTESTVDTDAASADADAAAEPAEAADATGGDDLADFDAGEEDSGATDETAVEATSDSATEDTPDAADVDLESTAVEIMDELDDGDGADREAVVAALVERYGADPDAADSAIQDALMSGKCYEPGEDSLKAI